MSGTTTKEVTPEDVSAVLEKWYLAKEEIKKLEAKCDSYKRFTDKVMRHEGKKSLESKYYRVTKRTQKRRTMSQQTTPQEIWEKYAKTTEFDAYYLIER